MKRLLLAIVFSIGSSTGALALEVKEVVTPSGIRAWLVEEHALPLVSVRVSFPQSGFAYDPQGKSGTANMLSAMLMEGAGQMDSKAFNEALESRAIRMNVGANEDKIETSAEFLSEEKDAAFSYLAMAIASPRFDESAMERTRAQTVSLLARQQQNPAYLANRAWQTMAYGTHGYSNPEAGDSESIKAITRDDLKQFATARLTRENMLIAVSGDITEAELVRLLELHFPSIPAQFKGGAALPETNVAREGKIEHIDFDIPQTILMFGTQGLKRQDPDYFTAYVMNHIIGGGSLTSKLSTEIREKRGLAYSVSSMIFPMQHAASWRGGFSTRTEKAPEAFAALKDTLRAFVANGPTQKEIDDAKQFLTGSFVLSLDSNGSITAFLISMQENKLGRDYFDKRNSYLQAVTREGVAAMAKRLIDPDKLIISYVGKSKITQEPQ